MRSLIDAALEDQERRVLESSPSEISDPRSRGRPLGVREHIPRIADPGDGSKLYCAGGCEKVEHRSRVDAGYMCRRCRRRRQDELVAARLASAACRKAARDEARKLAREARKSGDRRPRCRCGRRMRQDLAKTYWYCTNSPCAKG